MFNVADVLCVRNGSLRGCIGMVGCRFPPPMFAATHDILRKRKRVIANITGCVEAYTYTLISNHLSTAEPPFSHQGRRIRILPSPQ
jgi:hypothetical protein